MNLFCNPSYNIKKNHKNLSTSKGSLLISTFILLLILIHFNSNSLFAQEKNELNDIRGYIIDAESGEALVFANVIINDTKRGATTNSRGYFVIVDVETAKYTLMGSYIGYKSKEIVFDISKNKNDILQIELSPISIESEEVLVLADKYKIWKSTDDVSKITISPKQIASLPQLGEVDIFRSLQLLPGVSAVSDGSAGLYVRGGTPDQNLVMLDGMTVYHVDHFFGFFSAFNSEAIKDVQLYKAAYPAKFGGRLSSVVDLTGKTGNVNKAKLSFGANLLSVNGVAEIPISKKGSILLSARRSYADFINSGFYDNIYNFLTGEEQAQQQQPGRRGGGNFNQVESEVLPSFYFYDINAKVSYQLTKKDFLSFSFYNGEDFLDESEDPQEFSLRGGNNSAIIESDDITNWGNLGSSLKLSRQWSNRFYSDIIFSFSNYFSENIFENSFDFNTQNNDNNNTPNSFKRFQDNTINDITFRIDNDWNISRSHNIGFGLWLSNLKTKYDFTINDTTNVLNRDQEATQASLYLQDKWHALDNLELTFGLRGTYFNQIDNVYIEPRISLTYKVLDKIKLKGAWGNNYQFINRITNENVLEGSRDFWLLSDSELEPGFSDHFIIGTEYETNDYLFSIEGYYKNLENLIEFSQRIEPRRFQTNNANNENANFFMGTGISKGIEFLVQKKFGNFNGWLSYTLGDVEYTFPEIDNGDPFPACHDRTHEAKIVGSYNLGKWTFSGSWVFATGQAYTAPESQYYITLLDGSTKSYIHVSEKNVYRLPDYHRLDLSVSYKFKNRTFDGNFGLSIFNAYNNKNVWYRKYDLDVTPVVITDVSMLGITPTIFVKFNF